MKNKITVTHQVKTILASATVALLASCQSVPPQPTHVTSALDKAIADSESKAAPQPLAELPSSIQQELVAQNLSKAREGLLSERRLDIAARNVDVHTFFVSLVEDSAYSVVLHPNVSGGISLNLKDVTLDEALDVVQSLYGYDIRQQGKVIKVFPAGIRTETIPLNYLFVKRFGSSSTSINSGGVSENDPNNGSGNNGNRNSANNNRSNNNNNSGNNNNNQRGNSGTNIYTENESDFWKELEETLTALIGDDGGRSVIVSPQAGLVTVRALPDEIASIKKFIEDTQNQLRRQVIIEAKILEVTLNDDYQQGIQWGNVLGHIGSTDFSFSSNGGISGNDISATIGGVTSLAFTNADFSGVIKLLSSQGNVQVLSSPRITATNNQKAVIKVGEDEYYVTEVSSTTTTGTATTTTPQVELAPFFSGIALDVTPQIDAEGEVILHVHPSVTLTDEQVKTIRLGDQDYALPLAQSSVRESDTIVRAKSGEIVVIGGLIETTKMDMESKTPLLGDIPFMGELFKNKAQKTQKKELVIMLKPVVIGQDTWKNQLQDARQLLRQWFPEGDESGQ